MNAVIESGMVSDVHQQAIRPCFPQPSKPIDAAAVEDIKTNAATLSNKQFPRHTQG